MKLSTKGRYAVTALADIALQGEKRLVSLSEIAERQDISLAYLEQLFVKLRRAALVESVRGPGGGYRLAQPAAQTRISAIMAAVDETLNAMEHSEEMPADATDVQALAHKLWEQLSATVYVFLNQTTLADVIHDRLEPCPAVPGFMRIMDDEEART